MNNLVKYEDQITGDKISYDDAVERVKDADQKYQWILGEICDKLEPKYGENTLQKFAEEIERNYDTLMHYKATYRSWKTEILRPRSYSVAQELAPLPSEKKKEILETQPEITRDEAREKAREFKKESKINEMSHDEYLKMIKGDDKLEYEELENQFVIKAFEMKKSISDMVVAVKNNSDLKHSDKFLSAFATLQDRLNYLDKYIMRPSKGEEDEKIRTISS